MRRGARRHGWVLRTSGIGATAITEACAAAPGNGTVVLAGVAGALHPTMSAGSAWQVTEVYTEEGIVESPQESTGIRVTGADVIIATPEDKLALNERTGAHLVDMESHAFAEAMQQVGRPWAIFRGVSDGIEHSLPPGCDRWFAQDGGFRLPRACLDLLAAPHHVPPLLGFAARTRSAMRSVASLVEEFLTAGVPPRR